MNTKNKKIIQILLGGLITWIYFFGIYWIGSKQTPSANQDEVNQLSDAENTKFHLNGTWYIVKNSDFDPQNPVISTNTVPINSLDSLPNWYKGEKIWLIYHSVDADSQLFNKVFHLIVNQKGASSVYLNKNLLLNIGKPSNNPENEICVNVSSPFLFYVDKPFTIYIEHSEQTPMIWKNKINYSHLSGLKFEIHSYHKSDADFILSFIIGFLITLACIHLLLFFFYTEIKDNLYFSLFLFFYTCVWIAIIMSNSKYFLTNLIGNKLIEIAIISTFIALIFFVQHLFKQYLNKILWALFICIFIFSVLDIFYQNSIIEILNITGIIWLIIFSVIFIFITVYRSAKQNIPGIKIVSFGILIFGILIFTIISLIFYEFISNFGSSHSNFSLSIKENDFTGLIIVLLLFLALFSIPISMSIYLAYKFAYTNKVLKNKLSEVENLNKTIIEKEKEKQLILQKQNELLEQQVKERTQEIFEQKNLIEQKNKDILDSINYASRIQKALITSDEYIQNHFQKESFFQDYFVLYLPKDIVSGDFYWANVNVQHPDKPHYLAVCDCTGHGVPGAFMSLLNINFLNEAIQERQLFYPNDILNYVRQKLIQNLSYDEQQKDGMDASLILFDQSYKQNFKIYYALANHQMIVVRNKQSIVLYGDKMPVGHSYSMKDFNLYEFQLLKDDWVYLFTDGYKDQFGGEKGKRIMHKKFVDIITDNSNQPPDEQLAFLHRFFTEWKQNQEQTDDVCIMGFKV